MDGWRRWAVVDESRGQNTCLEPRRGLRRVRLVAPRSALRYNITRTRYAIHLRLRWRA
jgi:hypothetical protein